MDSNFLIIDLNKCFECNEPKDDMHHIIPKSKGGKKTIPLCSKCHGIVHDRDFVKHRKLLLDGVARAKKEGKYKGRIKGTVDCTETVLNKHKKTVEAINLNPNLSLRKIAKLVTDDTYSVTPNTILRIKKILLTYNNN
jgi:hypothetical protein